MNRKFALCFGVCVSVCLLTFTTANAQSVSVTPAAVTFAAQGVGTTSASQTVTLKNTSTTQTLSITSVAVSGEFPSSTTCGSSLASGKTCTVTVSFSPNVIGAVDGAITFVDNASPGTQIANLTGKGVAPLTISPVTLKFPNTAIGKTSAALNVTLTNSPTALTMGTVSASGDYTIASNTCTGTIAASKTCVIGVTFAPTVAGVVAGALTVRDSASNSPQVVALSGTGTGTVTNSVSFTPSSITFANQPTGTTSASQTVTLKNNGTSALSISAVSASGDYSETNTCAGKSIAANGGTCTIKVSFAPTTTGNISGVITVTDAAVTSPQVVPTTGTGITTLTLSPSLLTFSGQVGVTGPPLSATLTNNSNHAVTISSVKVSGDYSQTNTCSGSVAANSSCSFAVTFSPLVGGIIDGAVTLTTSASGKPLVLNLAGSASRAPIARFAYSLQYSAYTLGLVVAYSMNPVTGVLEALETVQLPSDNYGIVVHPSSKFLYIPDGAQILGYSIAGNGLLTPLTDSPFNLSGGSAMKFTPSGKFAYTNNGAEYSVNTTTGALTSIGTATLGNVPYDVTLSPNGNFLYIPNFSDGTISAFTVNQTSGALTAISGSPFPNGDTGPSAVAVSPNGKFLFVTNASTNNAGSDSVFSINSTTGALTPVTGSPFSGSGAGNGVTVDPTGHFLYVASDGIDAYTINQTTGALTPITGSPYTIPATANSVALDPTGKYLYASIFGNLSTAQTAPDVITYLVNPTTGALTQRSSQGVDGNQGESLAISTGTKPVVYTPKFAYATNQGSQNISEYSINAGSGALTAITGSPLSDTNGPQLIVTTPSGQFAYTGNANNSISEYKVNASTGALTAVTGSPIKGFGSVNGLAVDPAGGFLLVLDAKKQVLLSYNINQATGALTSLSNSATPTTTAQALTLDPTGTIAIITSLTAVDYYLVNNGALSPLKAASGTSFPIAVATDRTSQYAFVAENSGNAVATYSIPFGAQLSSATTGNNPTAIAAEPSGKYVYVANSGDGTISAYSLNIATGALTQIGTAFPSGAGTDSLSTSNDGKYLYATNNTDGTVSTFSINTNGTLTSLGTALAGSFPTSIATTGTLQ
jgi:6-phosphogluconolactonase (cycloisomerase 2 family)